MRKGRRVYVLLAGALAITAVLAGEARAGATTTTGGGVIQGTVTEPYPCACTGGTITATAALSLSGVPESGDAYSAIWPDPRTTSPGTVPINLTGGVSYTNQCSVAEPVPPLLGGGSASITISGGLLVVNGTVWDNATFTGALAWQWEGPTTAVATLTGATVTGGAGPGVIAVTLNLNNMVVGQGAMTFTWSPPMGNCIVQNPNQTALVQAALEQPA